jgi:GH24 family phage-related lysozyme (muramidase)
VTKKKKRDDEDIFERFKKTVRKEDDEDIFERFKKTVRKEEGKASDLKSFSEYTGLRGKKNTRVKGSSDYGVYYDSKGKLTGGSGRLIRSEEEKDKFFNATKKESEKALDEDVKKRVNKISRKIEGFNVLRPKLQNALFSSWYRGSLPGSPKTIKKINEGDFKGASKEFLDNNEYREEKRKEQESGKKSGVATRMEETANQLSVPKEVMGPPQKSSSFDKARKAMDEAAARPVPKTEVEDTEQVTNFSKARLAMEKAAARPIPRTVEPVMASNIIEEEEEELITEEEANLIEQTEAPIAISRTPDMANTKKKDDEELYGPPIEEPRKLEPSQQPDVMMTANTMVENLPSKVNENMPSHLKDRVAKRSLNIDNVEADGAKAQQAQMEGKQGAIDDKFMSAIGFFLPAIIGGLVGQQSGEGGAGVQLGLQASGAYHKAKNAHAESLLKQKALKDKEDFSERRVQVSESNLALRRKELGEQMNRTKNLMQERGDRRYERYDDRANKMKEHFIGRNDVKSYREQVESFHGLEEMVTTGKKIPQGALGLVAKGLSGEKGVLTDADIARAQVNPDIWNKMKRGYYINFKGEINPTDAKEILKIAKVKAKKLKERMRTKVGNFAKSRSKTLTEEHGEMLGLDLNLELGLEDFEEKEEEKKEGKSKFSRAEIDAMKAKIRARKK